MKKLATRLLALLILIGTVAPATMAAAVVVPVSATTPAATTPATSEPDPEAVKSAMKDFKDLSRTERRSRLKEAKKIWKDYRAAKKRGDDVDVSLILLAILAILLPPLAVGLKEGELNAKFWISLILTLLVFIAWPLWFISVLFALLVVFDAI